VPLFSQDWYYLSKTLAEREAFAYAEKTGLDIVTVLPSLVIGPLMQSTVNSSSEILLNYLKGGFFVSCGNSIYLRSSHAPM
jgi:nucleoside-diphosphate-sugar epimerase